MIFPDRVLGSAGAWWMTSGIANGPIFPLTKHFQYELKLKNFIKYINLKKLISKTESKIYKNIFQIYSFVSELDYSLCRCLFNNNRACS